MAEGKKSFVVYCDLINVVEKLPNEKAGELFKFILEYVNDRNPETDDLLMQVLFEPIKLQMKRDLEKWEKTSIKRSDSGTIGGIKSGETRRKQKEANESIGSFATKKEANEAVTVTVNDTVTVNVTDTINKKVKYPAFEEFKEYCSEKGFEHIADKAFKYYSESNWTDKNGTKVKNWKQKLTAVWFDADKNPKPKSDTDKFIRTFANGVVRDKRNYREGTIFTPQGDPINI